MWKPALVNVDVYKIQVSSLAMVTKTKTKTRYEISNTPSKLAIFLPSNTLFP